MGMILSVQEAKNALRDFPPAKSIFIGPPLFVKGLQNACVISKIALFGGKRRESDFDVIYFIWKDKAGRVRAKEIDRYILPQDRFINLGAAVARNGRIEFQATAAGLTYLMRPVLSGELNLCQDIEGGGNEDISKI